MIIEHTGFWLREQRLYWCKTQKEMAKFFGVKRGTYSSWESRYKRKKLPHKILKLCIGYLIALSAIETSREICSAYKFQQEFEKNHKKESIWKRILKWIKN